MNGHEILACLELAVYGTLSVPVMFCTFYYLLKGQTAWFYLHLFMVAKIAGPAIFLSISDKKNPSSDLETAAQILYSIALGPLLSATLSFVNTSSKSATTTATPSDSYSSFVQMQSNAPFKGMLRFVHPVIMVGLVLGIIGGVYRTPDSQGVISDWDKYDRGATFAKASGALFLVALAAIALGVAGLFRSRASLPTVSYYVITVMPLVLPLILLRVIYSILNAANLDTTDHRGHTTRFNLMQGSWVIYLFLAFIPQSVTMLAYTGCGVLAWFRDRKVEKYGS
ncbi:hypothetical protein BJX70DRAFT_394277 [Aspergillus crustosus]